MNWESLVSVIFELLPGFVALTLFYLLTAYKRPSPFEQVIVALVLSMIVKAIVILLASLAKAVSGVVTLGVWTENTGLVWSVILGAVLGAVLAWSANNDFPFRIIRGGGRHPWLRWIGRLRLTTNTARPSEWYSAFTDQDTWITLYLDDDTRLFGYPMEWPDQPDTGHFILLQPTWILEDGTEQELPDAETMLVAAGSVRLIEFLRSHTEVVPRQPNVRSDASTSHQEKESNDDG